MPRRIADLVRGLATAIVPASRLVRGVIRRRRDTVPLAESPLHLEAEHGVPVAAEAEPPAEVQFWGLQPPPELTPANYRDVFTALQRLPGPKVLDLTAVRLLSVDVFEALASEWTTSAAKVPRLALVLTFERWVMLRPAILALRPVLEHGVEVVVAYEEQYTGGQVAAWIAYGQLRHNPAAVITHLTREWRPLSSWPVVIDALADLVRSEGNGQEAALLVELAALALDCGGPDVAAPLAREALSYLPALPSETRSRALRHLGSALVLLGRVEEGTQALDQAIAAGVQSDLPAVAANPLYLRGRDALQQGDYLGAERRFRSALTLLATDVRRRDLLRLVHRGLALTLARIGHAEAEHHARMALGLHEDPYSEQAVADRQLVADLAGMRSVN